MAHKAVNWKNNSNQKRENIMVESEHHGGARFGFGNQHKESCAVITVAVCLQYPPDHCGMLSSTIQHVHGPHSFGVSPYLYLYRLRPLTYFSTIDSPPISQIEPRTPAATGFSNVTFRLMFGSDVFHLSCLILERF